MAGMDFGTFARFECPVSGNRAAVPRLVPRFGGRAAAKFAAQASGGFVRMAVIDKFLTNV